MKLKDIDPYATVGAEHCQICAQTNLYLVRSFPCSLAGPACPSPALFPTLYQSLGFITQISARPERIFIACIFITEKTKYAANFLNLAAVNFGEM